MDSDMVRIQYKEHWNEWMDKWTDEVGIPNEGIE